MTIVLYNRNHNMYKTRTGGCEPQGISRRSNRGNNPALFFLQKFKKKMHFHHESKNCPFTKCLLSFFFFLSFPLPLSTVPSYPTPCLCHVHSHASETSVSFDDCRDIVYFYGKTTYNYNARILEADCVLYQIGQFFISMLLI